MKVIVSGASGLIGSALCSALRERGDSITALTRGVAAPGRVHWQPGEGPPIDELEGHDAVVHLAGESIAGRWTAEKKARIRESREIGTRDLAATLRALKAPPRTLVCASAIGYYGDRGDEQLSEKSAPGADFLAEVCSGWEAAAEAASAGGVRVVRLRIGVVLSDRGGALAEMLGPFRMGLGGRIGSGRQWMSWITIDDLVSAILFVLGAPGIRGAVNAVAPTPVTNRDFTTTLGRVLHRPTVLPMPAFAVRLAFGEMGDALLLSSARVTPKRLGEAGFPFAHAELEDALRAILG